MIEYLPLVLTGIGIIASILYYSITLRNSNKTRQMQVFISLYNEMAKPEEGERWMEMMNWEWSDKADFAEKYGPDNNRTAWAWRMQLYRRYNAMGLFLQKGLIEADWIYDYFGSSIIVSWDKFKDMVIAARETAFDGEEFCKPFEYLHNEMVRIRKQRGFSVEVPERPWSIVER
jgi:hypothetical protein